VNRPDATPSDPSLDGSDQRRKEREELLILAQEAGGVGIFEIQVRAQRMHLSATCLSLYGLAAFDDRYETWLRSVYREDQTRVVDFLDSSFAARLAKAQVEFRIVRPDDGAVKWIEARGVITYDAEGRPTRVVGVMVDVTERKRAVVQMRAFTEMLEDRVRERTRELEAENEARRKAEEALRQAQKMEAVGQLTGGIAHDFNNLLTIILGGLEMIGRQLPLLGVSSSVSRIARARDMALQGVRRAATLTQRLLAFARQQALDPKPVDANRLVGEISEMLRRTVGETIAFETVLAGGLWRTFADTNQLENALLNLAVNARDAMPNGGKMTIETANASLDEAYVAGLAEPVRPGQYVLIAVADTGVGMPREVLDHVFEPFFTTKGVGKGTGLGLSQVYGFVRQSAGHVRIYSEPGEGSTVKIYLPRHTGSDEAEQLESRLERRHLAGIETILVVEDDDALRAYAVEILTELGYRVLEAPNGAAALSLVNRESRIDLLFTDIVMPGGVNGRQLADEVVHRIPGIRVLFTTGYTRNAIVHHGRLDPGVHLIGKPFSFDELAIKVRNLLDEPR